MDLASVLGTTGATLLGGTLGALVRLAPEVLKLIDRGNERKHELALLDKNTAAEAARATAGLREHELDADKVQVAGALEALKEAIKGQGQPTGVAWVDAVNSTVRPILTYGVVGPYVFGKLLIFAALLWVGLRTAGLTAEMASAAIAATYTVADMAIVSGILNFWFLGRVFDKRS